MRKRTLTILTLVCLTCCFAAQAINVRHVPYYMSFSGNVEQSAWQFLNSDNAGANTWLVARDAEYAYFGDYMLFMSQDGGHTRSYTTVPNQEVVCIAYCPIENLPAGRYTLDYHYMGPKDNRSSLRMMVSSTAPTNVSQMSYNWSDEKPADLWWQDDKYSFTADGQTTYYICFRFSCNRSALETEPGWAVDAIQIYPAEQSSSCALVPNGLTHTRSGNSSVFRWEGNASEYQVEFYMSDTSAHISGGRDNVTSTSYTVHGGSVPEGTYHFRVRAICSEDTSAWEALDYQLIYDASRRCIDYIDVPNKVDSGFESSSSRQTIHHYPHDYDERTNYKLRTFPKGFPAAVRVGNWETGVQTDEVVYTVHVTPEMGVLQLQYAMVLQIDGHTAENQPRFTLEFLDENGQLFNNDSCGYMDFTATTDRTPEKGWHTETMLGGGENVVWKEWSQVGLNMHDYANQTVKIRITSKDCGDSTHYGYGYFAMSCSPGIIEGTHCGVEPDSLWVDDGFYYRWYHEDDPTTILGSERMFHVQYPRDTAIVMCVDMINKIDTTCYFTLKASTLAFKTIADINVQYEAVNCQNYLNFSNFSKTVGLYTNDFGQMVEKERLDTVVDYYWDFGEYGRSTVWDTVLAVKNSGGNLHVELHTFYDNRQCEEVAKLDIRIPAIGPKRTEETLFFCEGASIFIGDPINDVFFGPTDLEMARVTLSTGCDSTHWLLLRYFPDARIDSTCTTLCESVGSMSWRGRTLTEAGIYKDTVRSRSCGCDSVIYILNMDVQPILDVQVEYEQQSLCSGSGSLEVPFTIVSGSTSSYDLLFSDTVFADRLNQPIGATDKLIIDFNEPALAGQYEATLVFHNKHCDTLHFALPFAVYYNADSLITQRWNDFLSVRKTAFDYYGGFYDYQWYKDGVKLEGETGSQLYLPNVGFDTTNVFAVELTRTKDSVRMRTCDFHPTVQPDSSTLIITVNPTLLSSHRRMPVRVYTSEAGYAELYYQSGELIGKWAIKDEKQLYLPAMNGLYLLRVISDSGRIETRKILVE